MRTVGLLLLSILFPAFVHAADPPSLTTYTISHDTIYPTATVESGLATTTVIDTAFSEAVKVSIKITSESGALIKSLYSSSSVTNPTPKIWNGTNTAGAVVDNGTYTILIFATSTATDLSMIDSSKIITVASSDPTPSDDSSGTTDTTADTTTDTITTPPSSGGGPTEYLPIPTLRIITSGNRTVSSGADVAFTASVYDGKGNKRDDAVVTWSFGDGMRRVGASVFHPYYDPGEYVAVTHVTTSDGGDALAESIIIVKNAGIKIASISARGIDLTNNDSRTLDLSLWRLSMGGQEFKIPENTKILAGHTVLFPSRVIELPTANEASLLYPSGEVATTYPATSNIVQASVAVQPAASVVSYQRVQAVEPIISTRTNVQVHEEAVIAPSAVFSTETAEGAALPPTLSVGAPTSGVGTVSSLFKSPWTLGFIGTVILASGAFILL